MYSYTYDMLFSETNVTCTATVGVIASNYFSPRVLISRGVSVDENFIEMKHVYGHSFPITSDKNINTCVNAVQEHQQLQAIFTAPTLPPSNQLSIEVILKNVDDCSSPAWTWFVESECRPGVYTECACTQIYRVAEFTHCAITCVCWDSCDFIYLKHNRLPLQNQTSEQLCEMWAYPNGRN